MSQRRTRSAGRPSILPELDFVHFGTDSHSVEYPWHRLFCTFWSRTNVEKVSQAPLSSCSFAITIRLTADGQSLAKSHRLKGLGVHDPFAADQFHVFTAPVGVDMARDAAGRISALACAPVHDAQGTRSIVSTGTEDS
jgi:hypothetical protein